MMSMNAFVPVPLLPHALTNPRPIHRRPFLPLEERLRIIYVLSQLPETPSEHPVQRGALRRKVSCAFRCPSWKII